MFLPLFEAKHSESQTCSFYTSGDGISNPEIFMRLKVWQKARLDTKIVNLFRNEAAKN